MENMEILKLKSKGYCCSQIMVALALDLMGKENPDLIAFARGLCMGYGSKTGDCGILTAGVCILSLYLPRDTDRCAAIQEAFLESFEQWTVGKPTCQEITGEFYPAMHPSACGDLLSRAQDRLVEILVENGIDPADPDA